MTAAEVETLAKLAYESHREAMARLERRLPPWEGLQSINQESWRAVVRCIARALKERR